MAALACMEDAWDLLYRSQAHGDAEGVTQVRWFCTVSCGTVFVGPFTMDYVIDIAAMRTVL